MHSAVAMPDEAPLLILGTGGFARELVGWMAAGRAARMPVALVHHTTPPQREWCGLPIRAIDEVTGPARYLLGVGPPAIKAEMVQLAAARGWQPAEYVDPSALVGLNAQRGQGCIICPHVTVSSDTVLGDFVTVNCRSAVGHDARVGDYSTLLGTSSVNGGVQMGQRVLMGACSTVHPKRRVGDGATIGIGSVVIGHVAAGTTVFGNPARPIS